MKISRWGALSLALVAFGLAVGLIFTTLVRDKNNVYLIPYILTANGRDCLRRSCDGSWQPMVGVGTSLLGASGGPGRACAIG